MKKNRFFVFGLIALGFTLILAGCRENPKALAKQTYDLTQDALSSPLKMAGSLIKAANIKKKVDKLSAADRQIYNEELARLSGQGEGDPGKSGGSAGGSGNPFGEALNSLMGIISKLNLPGAVPGAPAEETAEESSGGKAADSKSSASDWTWTIVDVTSIFGEGYNEYINAIAYGKDKFVAVGGKGKMAYSPDGVKWTAIDVSSIFEDDKSINAIAYGKDKFVAVGSRGKIAYSSDGITWTAVETTIFDYVFRKETYKLSIAAIAWGNGKFVAVGSSGIIAYSSDGITWTAVEDEPFDSTDIKTITFGKDKFVAGTKWGKMAASPDGITWIDAIDISSVIKDAMPRNTIHDLMDISAIAWGKDKFVAGGGGNAMVYSSDGVEWTGIKEHEHIGLTAIVYANNMFVAGGVEGTMATSKDGVNWTVVGNEILGKNSQGWRNTIYAVTFGNKKFVVGGWGGKIAYSTGK